MMRYTMYDFDYGNYCCVIEVEKTKVLIGSFINEDSVIGINRRRRSEMDIDNDGKDEDEEEWFPFTKKQYDMIKGILLDLNVIVIHNFNAMLGLPFILAKFNINLNSDYSNIQLLTTEPLIQLSKCYMEEFYNNFNSFLISNTSTTDPVLITFSDITNCLNAFVHLSYNQRYNSLVKVEGIDSSIILSFKANGYELGSFNVLIEYFNKRLFLLTQSSLYSHRYPLDIDTSTLEDCDILLQFPHVINYYTSSGNSYDNNIAKFVNEINGIARKSSINSNHYPYIFLIVEPWFMLEFLDILRHSIMKEIKVIYVSKSIDSMLKYSNINLNFINDRIYHKIYEFKQPFSYDELEKSEAFLSFNTFEEMMGNERLQKVFNGVTGGECPIMFVVNRLGYECFENSVRNLYEFFRIGMGKENDWVVRMNYDGEVDCGNVKNVYVDYNMTIEHYKGLIEKIKPKLMYINEEELDRNEEILMGRDSKSYRMGESNVIEGIDKEELVYSNAFTTIELRKSENISLNCHIENLKIFLSKAKKATDKDKKKIKEGDDDNTIMTPHSQIEHFEEMLKVYLECNKMQITECLCKENILNIAITSQSSSTASSKSSPSSSSSEITITINADSNDEPIIEIQAENYNDTLFFNIILSSIL